MNELSVLASILSTHVCVLGWIVRAHHENLIRNRLSRVIVSFSDEEPAPPEPPRQN